MPIVGQNKYRDDRNAYVDGEKNYKRKSIDEPDDYDLEDLIYLNNVRKNLQTNNNENVYVDVELGSTRINAIGINLENDNNAKKHETKESDNIKNELMIESPLNEKQRYQLTLIKNSNPSCPKRLNINENNNNLEVKLKHTPNHDQKVFEPTHQLNRGERAFEPTHQLNHDERVFEPTHTPNHDQRVFESTHQLNRDERVCGFSHTVNHDERVFKLPYIPVQEQKLCKQDCTKDKIDAYFVKKNANELSNTHKIVTTKPKLLIKVRKENDNKKINERDDYQLIDRKLFNVNKKNNVPNDMLTKSENFLTNKNVINEEYIALKMKSQNNGQMKGQNNGQMKGQNNDQMKGQTNGQMKGQTNNLNFEEKPKKKNIESEDYYNNDTKKSTNRNMYIQNKEVASYNNKNKQNNKTYKKLNDSGINNLNIKKGFHVATDNTFISNSNICENEIKQKKKMNFINSDNNNHNGNKYINERNDRGEEKGDEEGDEEGDDECDEEVENEYDEENENDGDEQYDGGGDEQDEAGGEEQYYDESDEKDHDESDEKGHDEYDEKGHDEYDEKGHDEYDEKSHDEYDEECYDEEDKGNDDENNNDENNNKNKSKKNHNHINKYGYYGIDNDKTGDYYDKKRIDYNVFDKNIMDTLLKKEKILNDDLIIYQRDNYHKNRAMKNINEKINIKPYEIKIKNEFDNKEDIDLGSSYHNTNNNNSNNNNNNNYENVNKIIITKKGVNNLNNSKGPCNNTQMNNICNKKGMQEKYIINVSTAIEHKQDVKIGNVNKTLTNNTKPFEKNSYTDKTLNTSTSTSINTSTNSSIVRNHGINKIINKNPANLNVSSKLKNDKTITYLKYEEITDFHYEINNDNINDMITKLVEITKDQEWTEQINNLINLRIILKYHDKLFFDNHKKDLRKICRAIIELVNSARSSVSKNALLCLSEFYSIGKKRMDSTLDDVIMPCLKKAYQTSIDFLSSSANNALLAICNACTEGKLISHFVKIATAKQKTYNLICLKCLIAVIIKFENGISQYKEMNKLIEALLECTSYGSAEIKCTARVALVVLDNVCPIKPLVNKLHIPVDKIKKITNLISRTSENEIDTVLSKINFI
ncbi:conserved protein, unknown function [Hepatocystis sp. ex Piliocolobus tephrosceles]|nr:conserved protein, unknown function [Hepatocystis sp. ex Piliocolobus tephrosceles]